MTIEEIIELVTIWDSGEGCYQDLELTEDELIDLYNEYFNN